MTARIDQPEPASRPSLAEKGFVGLVRASNGDQVRPPTTPPAGLVPDVVIECTVCEASTTAPTSAVWPAHVCPPPPHRRQVGTAPACDGCGRNRPLTIAVLTPDGDAEFCSGACAGNYMARTTWTEA